MPYLTLPSIYNRRLAQPSPTQPSLSSTSIRTLGKVHSGPADHTFYQSKKSTRLCTVTTNIPSGFPLPHAMQREKNPPKKVTT